MEDHAISFPVEREVSCVRFSHIWPGGKITNMEVDMFNQPMALAIKSEWTERVKIAKKEVKPQYLTEEVDEDIMMVM